MAVLRLSRSRFSGRMSVRSCTEAVFLNCADPRQCSYAEQGGAQASKGMRGFGAGNFPALVLISI
jgi:hypothetical protein